MKILLCYIAVTRGTRTADLAARFVSTYHEFPPGEAHETVIACNGGPLKNSAGLLFSSIPCTFYPRQNDEGWDISAYLEIARRFDSDLMICLGQSVYFHKPGWLKHIVDAYIKHGPGMYGFFSSHVVRAHLQTTAFACSTEELRNYTAKVQNKQQRYEFEHGQNAFWRGLYLRRVPTMLVTWDGVYGPREWRKPPNILWRGDQSNCLMFCNHTDHYFESSDDRKRNWSRSIDRVFA